jgi:high affinity sulfate transporter 1
MASQAVPRRRDPSPILNGILPLDTAGIPRDVIAGATLAALAIPEVMGYTKIAGTPVITGLYTILLPIIAFAILGSSRHLVVGADSATAAIMAAGLVGIGAVADSPQYVQLASLSALMCGVLLVAARLLRLGFIANFLSRSVLIGFLTGVGIQVAMGQVGGIFGVPSQTGGTIEKFINTLQVIPSETSIPTLVVSLAVLGTIVGLERVNKAIPGALFAVVGSIILSYALDLSARGVGDLGTVPGGLPAIGLPTDVMTLDNVTALFPVVVSMVVVILAQSAATSRAYAMKYRDSFDENVDLVGLGVANAAAGITGTFVVNGSPTKTEMVDSAGGRTQVAQLTAAAIVVVVLLFLTGPLAYMPNAVLASVVFLIGLRLVNVKGMADILRLRPGEFAVAAITALTVVAVGVEQAIILAMALSILEHIQHSYRPYDRLLTPAPDGGLIMSPLDSGARARPGFVAYRFGSGLYYANATRFTEEVVELVEGADPPLHWLCVAASAMGDIDYSGAETLAGVADELKAQGVTLVISDVNDHVRAQLDAYGLTAKIGEDHLFRTLREALAAYDASAVSGAEADAGADAGSTAPAPEPPASDAADDDDGRKDPSSTGGPG